MKREYWDRVAATYEEQIFSVLDHDHAGLIRTRIEGHSDARHSAADLGCGTGNFTSLLAQHFGSVETCDHSAPLLERAREIAGRWANTSFHEHDLASSTPAPFSAVDFALCVNVLIMADLDTRERAWNGVVNLVAEGGSLLLVVPSLESALYTNFRMIDWGLRAGLDGSTAVQTSVARHGSVRDLEQGVRPIEGVRTKHYLREELAVQLQDRGLRVTEIKKLTYDWTIEFSEPPEWMKAPHPWNWLVMAQRV